MKNIDIEPIDIAKLLMESTPNDFMFMKLIYKINELIEKVKELENAR